MKWLQEGACLPFCGSDHRPGLPQCLALSQWGAQWALAQEAHWSVFLCSEWPYESLSGERVGWSCLKEDGPSLKGGPDRTAWWGTLRPEGEEGGPSPGRERSVTHVSEAAYPVSLWGSRCWLACLPSLGGFLAKSPEPKQKKCLANSGMMEPSLSERARVLLGISPSQSSKYFLPRLPGLLSPAHLHCEALGQVSGRTHQRLPPGRGLA